MKRREDKISPAGRLNLKEALERLVELYDATGRADKAAEWKQKLAELEKAHTQAPPAPSTTNSPSRE